MKISDIDAFAAVVRCQTLSQAAAELGMTQPAITRRVQNLEEALGVTLLDRNTKPPRPTDIGRQVFDQCRAILREVDALRELTAARRPPAGAFRIGITQGLGERMLPELIARLASRWPALATQVTTAWGGVLVERIARRELDAALVFLAREMVLPPAVEGERLLATRLVAIGRKGDWPRRSYRLADCHARGWVLNPDGCGFRAGLRRALDAQGLPLPLVECSPLRDALEIVPLADFKPQIDLWLLRRQDAARFAAPLDAIAAQARDAFAPSAQDEAA
ncbi:LysR family transcriptional regulator [Burkholderia multivorans]|uniref:LysR family transcriptional regulator n=1 Tax=Burkholderia multivorans TaxID=87883 RepID=UPI00285859E7|nr:LysR family transcriptional regulator [Burkholderia multivorans]MDR8934903.1 HTH-type transcriptional regulator YofA [Burkholderia multivorans]